MQQLSHAAPRTPVATRRVTWPRAHPEVVRGARAMAVMLVGFLPFGLMLGATIGAHPEPLSAWAGTLLIYGGSAHLAVVQLTAGGAALGVTVLTGLLIHARLSIYSLSLAPHWRDEPLRVRILAAATLIDPTWAIAADRYARPGSMADKHRYHAGAVVTLTAGWLAMVTAGMALGPALSAGTGLHLAPALCLVALLVPRVVDLPAGCAVLVGGAVALAGRSMPSGTGMLAAISAGAVAGILADRAAPGTDPESRQP